MRYLNILIFSFLPLIGFGQIEVLYEYREADSLLRLDRIDEACSKFKDLEKVVSEDDTLYDYILWYYTMTVSHLEAVSRVSEDFESSLSYGLEALTIIQKSKERFDEEFAEREYYMVKNIIVSYYGLGNFEAGKKWKKKMYKAKKNNELPEGIDEYFNYDFFTFEDKNVWGYEWFAKLPKDRHSSSFTKVVYYIYSTNPDGSDKDQLYRLHLLMYHGNNKNFDYVLTKEVDTETEEVSGTFYSYVYKEDVDFEKLKSDVKEVLKGNLEPDTKRVIHKKADKDGKIKVDVELRN